MSKRFEMQQYLIIWIIFIFILILVQGCITQCKVSFATYEDLKKEVLSSRIDDSIMTFSCINQYQWDSTIILNLEFHTLKNCSIDSLNVQVTDSNQLPIFLNKMTFFTIDSQFIDLNQFYTRIFAVKNNYKLHFINAIKSDSILIENNKIDIKKVNARYPFKTSTRSKIFNKIALGYNIGKKLNMRSLKINLSFILIDEKVRIKFQREYQFYTTTFCYGD